MALEIGVQGVAQLAHRGLALLEDDGLDGGEGVDGMCRPLRQHAEGAVLRAAGRHVSARGEAPIDEGAQQRHGRDRVTGIGARRHIAHHSANHRAQLRLEGLPDILEAGELPRIPRVRALLRPVEARPPAVERPLEAEHDAQALEAEVRAPGDDDLPAAIVRVVPSIGRRYADPFERRDDRLVVEDGRHAAALSEHVAHLVKELARRVPVHAYREERVGHLVAAIALQQQEGERVGSVTPFRRQSADHDVLEPVVGRVDAVAMGSDLRGGVVSRPTSRIDRLLLPGIGPLLLEGLGALVELQAEAVHQLGRPVHVDPAGLQVGLEEGPHVLIQPPHRVAVHRGMEHHVHQPDGLQGLPERLRRARRGLTQVAAHLPKLGRPAGIRFPRSIGLAAGGEPLGVLHHRPDRDDDRSEERFFGRPVRRPQLRLRIMPDPAQPTSEEAWVVGHDVAEDRMDAQPAAARLRSLFLGGVVGEPPLGMEARLLQGHRAGEELPLPQVGRHVRQLQSQRTRLPHGERVGREPRIDPVRALPWRGRPLHRLPDAPPQIGHSGRVSALLGLHNDHCPLSPFIGIRPNGNLSRGRPPWRPPARGPGSSRCPVRRRSSQAPRSLP